MLLFALLSLVSCWTINNPAVAVTGAGPAGERTPFNSIMDPLELLSGQTLDLAFKLPPKVTPQMVSLYIPTTESEGISIPFKVKGRNARCVVHSAMVPNTAEGQILKPQILASGNGVEPKKFDTFEFFLTTSDSESTAPVEPVYKFAKLPEIFHIYKPQPKRVFFLFSLLAIVPIDFAFMQLLNFWRGLVGTNYKLAERYYPLLGITFAIEGVFLMYYLSWSIFSVISWTAILLPGFLVAAKKLQV